MKRKKKTRGKPRAKKLERGVCHVCGCTDDRGCDGGCSWADETGTICSACDAWARRASAKGAKSPSEIPVYGLWVVDGGPRGLGHWLVETQDGDNLFPAVYFDRTEAESSARVERNEGLDIVVVQLKACDRRMR